MNAQVEPAAAARAMLLTPSGRGAVATISVIGAGGRESVDAHFQAASGRSLREAAMGQIVYGRWRDAQGEEIVVGKIAANAIEIHCHGGEAAAATILRDLQAAGVQVLDWRQALQDSIDDSLRAEALLALPQATTRRTAGILWDQYRGALERHLQAIQQHILNYAADEALAGLDELLERGRLGLHLTAPWNIALVGRPNVGKSSMLNTLLGYGRAIVHDEPGTTRDLVTGIAAFDGWPCKLIDTAGLRETDEPIERAGVTLAAAALRKADLVLWVRDATLAAEGDDDLAMERSSETLVVWNKCDLVASTAAVAEGIRASALTGEGIVALTEAIASRLVPRPPARGEGVPFTPNQLERLRDLRTLVAQGELAEAAARMAQWLRAQQPHALPGEICEPN